MNKHLQNLKSLNPEITIIEKGNNYKILKPWNDKSISFVISKNKKLDCISNIIFPQQLVAIFDTGDNCLEFIYGLVDKEEKILQRKFDFFYKGQKFECSFSPMSKSLTLLAKSFKETSGESKSNYRNLRFLRDMFRDKGFFKEILNDAELTSFYVKGNFEIISNDYVELAKTLNFYMTYFDRETPHILILGKEYESTEHNKPCYFSLFDSFPEKINAQPIDNTLLEIFNVAHNTENIRLKFIFYFQVLEYSSYYYLNSKIKNKIQQTLKNPELATKSKDFSKSLIEDLKDHFSQNDDSIKLEQTISEYVTIEDLKTEIESNKDYFSQDIEFEGGLRINRIIKDLESVDKLKKDDLVLIKKNIEKIRNVLVHLRESRENKVILPTDKNDNLLLPYVYLIRRIAEKVAIQFE
jgi:hypothetical protein